MTTLTRWEPMRELTTMRDLMDRFFNEPLFAQPSIWERRGELGMALDVAEENDAFVVKASLPGVKPEDIDVTLSDNVLTIKGELRQDEEHKEEAYHVRERRWGSFVRSITLGTSVNADAIEATNEHGVLTLRLPKSEAVKPKKIPVRTMIEHKGNGK